MRANIWICKPDLVCQPQQIARRTDPEETFVT
jgi:hypothetical protein